MKLAVMIDPGHGGADSGAGGLGGILEKDINWEVACSVKKMLMEKGIKAELTRKENECPSLAERAERARLWGADIVIAVHHNAGGGIGFEIYHQMADGIDDKLAQEIATEFEFMGQVSHGGGILTKPLPDGRDYYGLLRECKARNIPAVITEFCYIDNIKDLLKIDEAIERIREAQAIAYAVMELCGMDSKAEIVPPCENELIVNSLKDKGWTNSPDYWHGVLDGNIQLNPEYLKVILKRALGI